MIYAVCSSVVISVVPTVWIHGLETAGDRSRCEEREKTRWSEGMKRPPPTQSELSGDIKVLFFCFFLVTFRMSSREEMKKLIITDKFFAVLSSMQERSATHKRVAQTTA